MPDKMMSLVCIAGMATFAAADQVSLQFGGVSQGRNVGISTNGGNFHNVYSGSVFHFVDGDRTLTYCIEPDQWAQTGTTNFNREALDDALGHRSNAQDKAMAIAELADVAGAGLWSETGDRDLASAFQIAVWEIVMDFDPSYGVASLDLGQGNFRANGTSGSSLGSSVQQYYNTLVNQLSFGQTSIAGYEAYTNPAHQDFMTQIPTPGPAALGLAALPMIASRRRR